MGEHGSAVVRAAVIVTAIAAIVAVVTQFVGIQVLTEIKSGVLWNKRQLIAIDDTLSSRTERFASIRYELDQANAKIDTLTARVARLKLDHDSR